MPSSIHPSSPTLSRPVALRIARPAASLLAAWLGRGLGAGVFRVKSVRGELFALLTLAITFVVGTIVLNTRIDGGPGIYLNSVAIPAIGPTASSSIYLMALLGAVATLLISYRIPASRLGRSEERRVGKVCQYG